MKSHSHKSQPAVKASPPKNIIKQKKESLKISIPADVFHASNKVRNENLERLMRMEQLLKEKEKILATIKEKNENSTIKTNEIIRQKILISEEFNKTKGVQVVTEIEQPSDPKTMLTLNADRASKTEKQNKINVGSNIEIFFNAKTISMSIDDNKMDGKLAADEEEEEIPQNEFDENNNEENEAPPKNVTKEIVKTTIDNNSQTDIDDITEKRQNSSDDIVMETITQQTQTEAEIVGPFRLKDLVKFGDEEWFLFFSQTDMGKEWQQFVKLQQLKAMQAQKQREMEEEPMRLLQKRLQQEQTLEVAKKPRGRPKKVQVPQAQLMDINEGAPAPGPSCVTNWNNSWKVPVCNHPTHQFRHPAPAPNTYTTIPTMQQQQLPLMRPVTQNVSPENVYSNRYSYDHLTRHETVQANYNYPGANQQILFNTLNTSRLNHIEQNALMAASKLSGRIMKYPPNSECQGIAYYDN